MGLFRYEDYSNPYVGQTAGLMLRGPEAQARGAMEAAAARARASEIGGQAQARSAEQSGAAWGGAMQQIGQGISGAIQQANDPRRKLEAQQLQIGDMKLAADKRAQDLNGTVNQLMSSSMAENEDGSVTFDRAKLRQGFNAASVPLPLQEQTFKSLDEVDKSLQSFAQARVDHSADVANSILTNPHGVTPETVAFGLALAKANGLASDKSIAPIIDAIAQGADPKAVLMQVRGLSEKYRKLAEPVKLSKDEILIDPSNPGGAPLASNMVEDPSKGAYTGPDGLRYNAKGVPITGEVMKPQTAGKGLQTEKFRLDGKDVFGTFDPATGKYAYNGQDVTGKMSVIPSASTQVNVGSATDVKEAVAGMIDGTIPPQLPGRASKEYTATLAEAHRQGYDLKKAATDYAAVQKHVATLNGAKFTTLLSSVKTASESLDVIDSLAKKWDGGGFPILNKANLALAKGGAYGPGAASIATQLEGQITDVVSELGQVYMGGNSPTDHALKLAEKNLSASWDKQVLLDMTKLARTNLSIRRSSIVNSEPIFSNSKENVSPTTTPSGMIGVTAPNGKTYQFKSQADADAFKVKAGIR